MAGDLDQWADHRGERLARIDLTCVGIADLAVRLGLIFARSRFLLRRLQNPMGRNFLWKSPRSPN